VLLIAVPDDSYCRFDTEHQIGMRSWLGILRNAPGASYGFPARSTGMLLGLPPWGRQRGLYTHIVLLQA
jgi:hypothetical protein